MKHEMCERCFEELCNDCYQRLASFEAHAVEVLARTLHDFSYKEGTPKNSLDKWYEQDRDSYRSQARELLGRKDNNNKEI